MRILLMKGGSQYGALRLFTDLAAAAFRRAGHEAEVLDLQGVADVVAHVGAHAPSCRTDLVFTISILGELRHEGRSIAELYNAPHVIWHTDYSLTQTKRLAHTPRSTALLFVDPTQVEGVKATLGPDYYRYLGFFPHPAVGEPAPGEATAAEFEANRPIPILWAGSFQKPGGSWETLPGPIQQNLHDAVDLALSVEWIAPHEALRQVFESRGLDMADPKHRGALYFAAFVDERVRMTRRFEFVKSVAKTGLPIHICGVGWEAQLYRFKRATYEGAVEMTRLLELMRRSRIVLNTNGNFGAGSHERPFSASLAGAATFSDVSRYYEEVFAPDEIAMYRWQDLPGAMAMLKDLAGNPERCFEMGRAAKARTAAGHTWDQRIGLILEAGEAVRA